MDEALKRSRRLHSLLEAMERVRCAQLAEIERKIVACKTEQEAVLDALSEKDPLVGQFVDLISRRVSSLVRQAEELQVEYSRRQQIYRHATSRTNHAERLLKAAKRDSELARENGETTEIVELLVQALGKSPPPN